MSVEDRSNYTVQREYLAVLWKIKPKHLHKIHLFYNQLAAVDIYDSFACGLGLSFASSLELFSVYSWFKWGKLIVLYSCLMELNVPISYC